MNAIDGRAVDSIPVVASMNAMFRRHTRVCQLSWMAWGGSMSVVTRIDFGVLALGAWIPLWLVLCVVFNMYLAWEGDKLW